MRRGFTLLELLITLSAGMVVVGLLLTFYLSYFRIWNMEFQKQKLNQQLISVSEKIARDIAQTGTTDTSELPFDDIQLELVENNLYKVTIRTTHYKQPYVYENYFRSRK